MMGIDACWTDEAQKGTLCDWGSDVVEQQTCEALEKHLELLFFPWDVSDLNLYWIFVVVVVAGVGLDPICSWLLGPTLAVGFQSGQSCYLTRLLHWVRAHYFGRNVVVVVVKATETLANLYQLKLQQCHYNQAVENFLAPKHQANISYLSILNAFVNVAVVVVAVVAVAVVECFQRSCHVTVVVDLSPRVVCSCEIPLLAVLKSPGAAPRVLDEPES